MTIDEQLAYLTKGCVDVVRPGELRAKLERAEKTGTKLTSRWASIRPRRICTWATPC